MTQQQALDILKLGHNVYLTGAAGSGKTYLLNQYINYLKSHKISVGITASTGIAATHMGGTTIHSWTGMGIRDNMTEQEIAELLKKQYLCNRFFHTKVLIIDEISMLHAQRLDLVHAISQAFKKNSLPFGGMQIVMCGDFFQLPPVTRQEKNIPRQVRNPTHDFVTYANIWKDMQLEICYLDEQFRQDDRIFLRVLNDIRNNEVNEVTIEYLSERMHAEIKGYTKPTQLYTHNIDVEAINKIHLDALEGEIHEYTMSWRGSFGLTDTLKKSCLAPETLFLKKGAQVMFVKNNFDGGYVNGTLAEVIGFDSVKNPIVRTFKGAEIVVGEASWEVKEEDVEKAAISQIPLRLAWAITVHKSQGMSLDAAVIDLSKSFIPGMGYVALSRVRNLAGLQLKGINQMALQVNQDVVEMDKDFFKRSNEAAKSLYAMSPEKQQQMQKDFLSFLQEK